MQEVKKYMSMKHKLVFISMILITILCVSNISVVFASDTDNNLTDNTLSEMDLENPLGNLNDQNKGNTILSPFSEVIEDDSDSSDL